jgi:predicted ATP-binding protein involved in virulence
VYTLGETPEYYFSQMHVTKLQLTNFRCFLDFQLTLDKKLTLLVAENAGGKTAVLDGLASALIGLTDSLGVSLDAQIYHSDVHRSFKAYNGTAVGTDYYPLKVEASLVFNDQSNAVTFCGLEESKNWLNRPTMSSDVRTWFKNLKKTQSGVDELHPNNCWPVLAYYRVGRGRQRDEPKETADNTQEQLKQAFRAVERPNASNFPNGLSKDNRPLRIDGWKGALNANQRWEDVYLWWVRELLEARANGGQVSKLCEAVAFAVGKALNSGENPPIWSSLDHDILVWVPGVGVSPFRTLSDGFRNMVALFADLAYRCALLNPHLGIESIEQTPGVILIDELELHLHPRWQKRIISDLQNTFPACQFVITTHSPQIINTVPPESLVLLRLENERVKIERVGQAYGLDVNHVLKHIMGVEPRPQNVLEVIEAVEIAFECGELDKARESLEVLRTELRGIDAKYVFLEASINNFEALACGELEDVKEHEDHNEDH